MPKNYRIELGGPQLDAAVGIEAGAMPLVQPPSMPPQSHASSKPLSTPRNWCPRP